MRCRGSLDLLIVLDEHLPAHCIARLKPLRREIMSAADAFTVENEKPAKIYEGGHTVIVNSLARLFLSWQRANGSAAPATTEDLLMGLNEFLMPGMMQPRPTGPTEQAAPAQTGNPIAAAATLHTSSSHSKSEKRLHTEAAVQQFQAVTVLPDNRKADHTALPQTAVQQLPAASALAPSSDITDSNTYQSLTVYSPVAAASQRPVAMYTDRTTLRQLSPNVKDYTSLLGVDSVVDSLTSEIQMRDGFSSQPFRYVKPTDLFLSACMLF